MPEPVAQPDPIILDWGKPGAPMVIQRGVMTQVLTEPLRPAHFDTACRKYATYRADAPANLQPGPDLLHLGFYGYLRVCNMICMRQSGISIFDLGDALWRDFYQEHRDPHEVVEEVLTEEGFPFGKDA